jgi:cyclophilin family peptidyl-prolyl cis-trans isomerase
MPRRLTLLPVCLLAVVALLVAAGCWSAPAPPAASSDAKTGSASSPPATETQQASTPPTPGQEPLHTGTFKPTGKEKVVIKTAKGDITIKVYPKDAPNTVATFLELVSARFYDGTLFHRVEPGFVIQGGDPLSKDPNGDPAMFGTGGPGFKLKSEFNGQKHVKGAVAMARADDPDSAGSQFYITLAPQPMLDGQYTVFGQVVSGMDVVDKIEKGDKIVSMTIVRD